MFLKKSKGLEVRGSERQMKDCLVVADLKLCVVILAGVCESSAINSAFIISGY